MKQYCRYCANCIYGDVVWCDELEKEISEASATHQPTKITEAIKSV